MTILGWLIVIVAALVLGIAAQFLLKTPDLPYRWIVSSIAAFVGAVAASEWLFTTVAPEFEGIAIWPALAGGVIVGVIVDLIAVWYSRSREHGGMGHGAPVH